MIEKDIKLIEVKRVILLSAIRIKESRIISVEKSLSA